MLLVVIRWMPLAVPTVTVLIVVVSGASLNVWPKSLDEPTAADPPLHDARLLPAILAPHSHVFLRADPGDVAPPYRAMVWYSDKVTS